MIPNSTLVWEKMSLPPGGYSATLTDPPALGSVLGSVSLCIPALGGPSTLGHLGAAAIGCLTHTGRCTAPLHMLCFGVTTPICCTSTSHSEVAAAPGQTSDSQRQGILLSVQTIPQYALCFRVLPQTSPSCGGEAALLAPHS